MIDQTHPILNQAATELTTERFAEYVAIAQEVYGIVGMNFSGTDEVRVDRALGLQINYMLSKGEEGELFQAISRGDRSFTFKDGLPLANRAGSSIIRSIIGPGHGFGSLPSARGHGNRKRSGGYY